MDLLSQSLRDLLCPYFLPSHILDGFVAGAPSVDLRASLVSRPALDACILSWADAAQVTFTMKELIYGFSLALKLLEPEPIASLGIFANVFVKEYPAIRTSGLAYARTAREIYSSLEAASLSRLWRLAKDISLQRNCKRRAELEARAMASLLEEGFSPRQVEEFLLDLGPGESGLDCLEENLVDPQTLAECCRAYAENASCHEESAFHAPDDRSAPLADQIPFWLCHGGCFESLTLQAAIKCTKCARTFCSKDTCMHRPVSPLQDRICHVCAHGLLPMQEPDTPHVVRATNFMLGYGTSLWPPIVARYGMEEARGLAAHMLGCSRHRLDQAIASNVLGPLLPSHRSPRKLERPPATPDSAEPPSNRSRREPGLSLSADLGADADSATDADMADQDPSIKAGAAGSEEALPLCRLNHLLQRFKTELSGPQIQHLQTAISRLEASPLAEDSFNILLVGFHPWDPDTLEDLTLESITTEAATDCFVNLALEHRRPEGFTYTWKEGLEGPGHVNAPINGAGASEVARVLDENQIDLVLLHPSLTDPDTVAEFLRNDDSGAYSGLAANDCLYGGAVIIPHLNVEYLGHLRGNFTMINREDNPVESALARCSLRIPAMLGHHNTPVP